MIVETNKEPTENQATPPQNLEIPEGKVLDHIELHCSKHEDITKGSVFLSYTTKQADGKITQHQNFFCVQCIADLLSEFAEQGKIGKLQMVRVFRDETPEDVQEKTEETPPQEN